MRSGESLRRACVPLDQTPIIKIWARRKCLSMIAAVTNQGEVRSMICSIVLAPPRLLAFTRRLIKDARRKVFLILDNLNVYKAKPIRDWLDEHAERSEVFCAPLFSLALGPREYFNGNLKGVIQRGIPLEDVQDLKQIVLSHSCCIQKSPACVLACFKNQHIRYAAAVHFNYVGSMETRPMAFSL